MIQASHIHLTTFSSLGEAQTSLLCAKFRSTISSAHIGQDFQIPLMDDIIKLHVSKLELSSNPLDAQPNPIIRITSSTDIKISSSSASSASVSAPVPSTPCPGYESIISQALSLSSAALDPACSSLDIPRALLLWGPSGVGKSRILDALSSQLSTPSLFVGAAGSSKPITPPIILSFSSHQSSPIPPSSSSSPSPCPLPDFLATFISSVSSQPSDSTSNSSRQLAQLLSTALSLPISKPSVFLLDDLEFIIGSNSSTSQLSLLTHFLDYITTNRRLCLVLATCSERTSLHRSLVLPGRFEKDLYIPLPNEQQRFSILKHSAPPISSETDEILHRVSRECAGYSAGDLQRLCRAVYFSLNPSLLSSWLSATESIRPKQSNLHINTSFSSSSFQSVKWTDIGGYEEMKTRLRHLIHWPLDHPDAIQRFGLPIQSGALLYGPSGCGKTLLARAIASEKRFNFISVKSSELYSKYYGETERQIRMLFRQARESVPCVLLIDEVDALGASRDKGASSEDDHGFSKRLLSQMLNEMDGVQEKKGVFILGCSNRPDLIDSALLRPGRFDHLLYIGPPSEEDRMSILRILTQRMASGASFGEAQLRTLAEETEGFTGAGLAALCREAALRALRENREATTVEYHHFEEAIREEDETEEDEDEAENESSDSDEEKESRGQPRGLGRLAVAKCNPQSVQLCEKFLRRTKK